MHNHYSDITERIGEEPRWYDANGTPRYGAFDPKACPNIYATEVGLFRIACQACGEEFLVEMHNGFFESLNPMKMHYGDPPNHDCVGDTMNCEDLECVECWSRPPGGNWARRPDLEGDMTEAWNYPSDKEPT